jgi:hypothetical protein
MPYKIAGIDVHKRMLAVVVFDVEVDGEYAFDALGRRYRLEDERTLWAQVD